jgi:putative hydrolase of the HAD superfamily
VNTSSVSVVVFDIGDVLCGFRPEARLGALASSSRLSEVTIQAAIWDSGLDAAADAGAFSFEECVAQVLVRLEGRIGVDDLLEAWAGAFPVNSVVIDLASRLHVRRSAFSNNGPLLEECMRRGIVDLGLQFQPVVFAWRIKELKPHRAAFEHAAIQIGTPVGELLLVDDSIANVEGAIAAGWQAVHFTNVERLSSDLVDLGLM